MLESVIVIVIVIAGWRLFAMRRRKGSGRWRCGDCRHLLKSFDDGVRCGYGGREVFKTPVHVSNCMDWEKR